MTRFRFAHAPGADEDAALEACLAQLESAPPGGLGMLYVSDTVGDRLPALLARLRRATGVQDWVGSVGTGICAGAREYYEEPAAAVMIADIPPESYRVFSAVSYDPEAFRRENGAWIARARAHVGVVHADPRDLEVPVIVSDIADGINGFLVGGLSSSRDVPTQIAGGVAAGGVSGVLLAETVGVATDASRDRQIMSKGYKVTAAQKNMVIMLDGRPALDVLRAEAGASSDHDLPGALKGLFVACPTTGGDVEGHWLREISSYHPVLRLFQITKPIERGATIHFCRRDVAVAEEEIARMVASVRGKAGPEPRGALYFSCVTRGAYLFGSVSREMVLIQQALGDLPLVGMFGNGQISRDRIYASRGVLALFS